jgi:hypothetical protein
MTVTDAEDAREIQDEANDELKRSLERQNLTVERYDWIFILVNGDDQLRAKVVQLVYEERKKPQ